MKKREGKTLNLLKAFCSLGSYIYSEFFCAFLFGCYENEGTVEFVVHLLPGFSFIICCGFPIFSE